MEYLPLALILVLLFMIAQRGRQERRAVADVQSRVTPGVQVVLTSGLFATVVRIEDEVVVLETGPGQQSRWDRRAIARVVTDPKPAERSAVAPTGDEPDGPTPPTGETAHPADPDPTREEN